VNKPPLEESLRAVSRETRRQRRIATARRRDALFDMAASGYSIEAIAAQFGLTPRAVRRDMAKTVAARRLDAPDHFIHLQVARLHKALRAAEAAVDRDDLRGIAGMVRIVAQLDRYHCFSTAAPPSLPALPLVESAPLALTHEPPRPAENLTGA
jgi:AraC-like DNA-binding protein